MRKRLIPMTVTVLLLLSLSLASLASAEAPSMTVVASGLNNPRGLAFGPGGMLYVAEAGVGGDGPCVPGPEGGLTCFGLSGSIARIDPGSGEVERIATGFPSHADNGAFAIGPHAISFRGKTAYIAVGLADDPFTREAFGAEGAGFAQLVQMAAKGKWRNLVDLGDFEAAKNPAGDEVDTNPYDVLALSNKQIVVDAGGNDLLEINKKGKVRILAIFPNRMVDAPPFLGLPPGTQIPMDAVPTSVALGPDGAYYVGQLTGFPFPVDGANVYRVAKGGGEPEVFASGFTNIIDIAFGPDGLLYVLEITKNSLLSGDLTGALIRVEADGSQNEILSEGLVAPGGIVFGADGAIYLTNNGVFPGAGEVLRIEP